jgi:hypothetical protein
MPTRITTEAMTETTIEVVNPFQKRWRSANSASAESGPVNTGLLLWSAIVTFRLLQWEVQAFYGTPARHGKGFASASSGPGPGASPPAAKAASAAG